MHIIIDLFDGDTIIDWKTLRQVASGAYLRATEGLTTNDHLFDARQLGSKAHMPHGCYHIAQPEAHTPEQEAQHFCDAVGSVAGHDFRPALHLDARPDSRTAVWAMIWAHEVEARLDVGPILYGYSSYLYELKLDRPILHGLWLASYPRDDGTYHGLVVPKPWTTAVAYQFSSQTRVTGCSGKVDLSQARSLKPLLAHPTRPSALRDESLVPGD